MELFGCLTGIQEFVIYTSLTMNPDPTLQLCHNKKTRASKRPTPTPRYNSLAVRKRAKLDTCSDERQDVFLTTQPTTSLVMVLSFKTLNPLLLSVIVLT